MTAQQALVLLDSYTTGRMVWKNYITVHAHALIAQII